MHHQRIVNHLSVDTNFISFRTSCCSSQALKFETGSIDLTLLSNMNLNWPLPEDCLIIFLMNSFQEWETVHVLLWIVLNLNWFFFVTSSSRLCFSARVRSVEMMLQLWRQKDTMFPN